jgi:hypothetical protein
MPYGRYESSLTGLYESGTAARAEEARRSSFRDMHRIKQQQRLEMIGTLSQLLGIGSSIWETYSSNKELIKDARKYGFEPTSSKFSQIFGEPSKFVRGDKKEEFRRIDIEALKTYENLSKRKSLIESVFGTDDTFLKQTTLSGGN